jgi:HPt (histidine-containing phosphotransfer) domain-containing protein
MTLTQMLEDPAFQEIVGELVAALPERMAQLQTAVREDDLATVRQLSHQLKGAGGGYGFDDISLAAAAVEKLCLEEAAQEELSHSIEQLAKECETARCRWEAN